MPRFPLPPQIIRLIAVTVVIVGSYLVARHFLTPPTFYQYGHYRGAALVDLASREPRYGGAKACDECHSDVGEKLAKDKHRTISCEACHGPARMHSKNPDVNLVKVTADVCLRCHTADPARPVHQKQIVPVDHHHEDKCTECHFPHQPNQSPS